MTYAATSTNNTTPAPHSKNAALRSESPYQQRTTQRDNPTQQLIKQAVDSRHAPATPNRHIAKRVGGSQNSFWLHGRFQYQF